MEGGLLFRPSSNPIPNLNQAQHLILPCSSSMNSTHLLDVVVGEGAAILKLLASEDQALLIRGDALLVLDLGLDIVDGVRGLDLEGDGLTRQCLHKAARIQHMSVN